MKNFLDILYNCILFVVGSFCIFSFFVFGLTSNAPLKVSADSNSNISYSNNFNTDSMPDYNRVILDNNSFYDLNSLKNMKYDFSIEFEKVFFEFYGKNMLHIYDYIFYPKNNDVDSLYSSLSNFVVSSSVNRQLLFGTGLLTLRLPNEVNQLWLNFISSSPYYNLKKFDDRVEIGLFLTPEQLRLNWSKYSLDIIELSNSYQVTISDLPFNNKLDSMINLDFTFINPFGGIEVLNSYLNNSIDRMYQVRKLSNCYFRFKYNVFNHYYFNYGELQSQFITNQRLIAGISYYFKDNINSNYLINVNDSSFYGWYCDNGIILDNINLIFQTGDFADWLDMGINIDSVYHLSFNYCAPNNLVNGFGSNNSNYDSTDLYKQDVQWYDVFGHLYNFMIYIIFDMPLISNITKPIYYAIDSFVVTLNWANGIVLGLGIFGAFAMVCLTFAIIKRFL